MYKYILKRILDLFISGIVLLCLSPIYIVIWGILTIVNKGTGAFFYQERPGKDEQIFKIYKFKSMTDERDEDGNLLPDKIRLTKVGRFIRKTSLDELPQLWNVLKGDMSLIGPRPLLPEYLPYYTQAEKIRHSIRPGITGWAQINGRNNLDWDKRLEFDVYYVKNLSFILDLKIFTKTILNIIKKKDVVVALDPKVNIPLHIKRRNDNQKAN